ncbi:MAG: hypothetical protein GY862_01045 [Gammaproteobacteria bacterium]|nr:hypothetical protein [Gammaproteobacteria bacterium]
MRYLIIFLILLPSGSHANAVKNGDLIRKGDRHFNRGEYSEALAFYRQAHVRLKNQKPASDLKQDKTFQVFRDLEGLVFHGVPVRNASKRPGLPVLRD